MLIYPYRQTKSKLDRGNQINTFNRLVNEFTAFRTFAEMRVCLDNGYVPTIYPRGRAHRKLIGMIRAAGYRVWTGSN